VIKYAILMVVLIIILNYIISYSYALITGENIENAKENSFSQIFALTLLYVNNSMLRFIVTSCKILWFPILNIGVLLYFLGLKQLGCKTAILSLSLAILNATSG